MPFFRLPVTVAKSLPIFETMPMPVMTTLFINIFQNVYKCNADIVTNYDLKR
ncbi:hypothetical protein [Moraxella lacunata]|uniref:hypothetical protein n=1 Tax=Moraxella lacunata TaxID=477 RepID=UPI003EE376FF